MHNAVPIEHLDGSEIAIIGMACRFPGANNLDEFWRNLRDGVESIAFFADDEIELSDINRDLLDDPNYVKAGPVLDGIDLFDAAFFGYTHREAEIMDPQHRLMLECAWESLEHAGYDPESYRHPIGIFTGARTSSYKFNLYLNPSILRSFGTIHIGLGNDLSYLSTRIAYKLNLRGPSYSLQTACSTSLVAVHLACQSLLLEECRMALAGGVVVSVPHKHGYRYQEGGMESPDGHCRTFDADAQGTVFGNGLGMVVLKRLTDALTDGDCIHAVIRGSATNNDGALKASFTAPGVSGQTTVIAEALTNAGVPAETIGYVEAHGTGTPLGDPIEMRALTKAFRATTSASGFCAIGSVKPNIGHLDAAAGIAGLIKTVLALEHRQIPPLIHFQTPNPAIDFADSPFYVNTELIDWPANGHPRRAGLSSFGAGGANAHAILEEAPPVAPSGPARPWQLLLLSARSAAALERATDNLVAHLQQHPVINLADVAYTLQVGRKRFDHRRMLLCRDHDDALTALAGRDAQRLIGDVQETRERPIMFLFPGQGAQYAGMAADLYRAEPLFRETVDHCAELLRPHLGRDIREMLYPSGDWRLETGDWRAAGHDQPPASSLQPPALDQTQYAQPALFAVEYALARLWMRWGVRPQAMIGHSIGEYVAACLAGVFSLEDVLALVAARGRLMQQLPAGAMLSVALPAETLQPLLRAELSLAAVNGPALCVVAGPSDAVAQLQHQLAARGVDCRRLHTSHAFHSAMMDPILEPFAALVGRVALRPPTLPYLSNLTGGWISAAEATDPGYWVAHLRQTVRFADGLQALLEQPDAILLEVGPGKTLGSLVRQQPAYAPGHAVLATLRHPYDEQADDAFLLTTLGRLWLAGARIDWAGVYAHERRLRVPLPSYPFERQRYWIALADQPAAARPRPAERSGVHPLLGQRLDVAPPIIQFEAQLRADDPAYLRDHQIQGVVLLPAAGYLEMALTAATMLPGAHDYVLAGVAIEQALVVVPGEEQQVQLVVTPEGSETFRFGVYSSPAAARDQPERWALHARGTLRREAAEPGETARLEPISGIQERCAETIIAPDLYRMLRAKGFQFGPTFQGVEQIWRRDGEALGRIRLPDALAPETDAYRIHPALLDACLQVLSATLPAAMRDAEGENYFLPVGFSTVRFAERPGAQLWSHVLLRQVELTPGTLEGDLRLLDDAGRVIAELIGIQLRRVGQTVQPARQSLEDWLYTVEWQPQAAEAPDIDGQGGAWLILADAGGLGHKLAMRLESVGDTCVIVTHTLAQQAADRDERAIDPADLGQLQQLIGEMAGLHQDRWRGVVHLWSLDAPPADELAGEDLLGAQQLGCISALHLAQTLVSKGLAELPRLWLVTRGTQAITADQRGVAVAQAPLWGLGKVIALEHPELGCVLLDLDPAGSAEELDLLAQELRAPGREDQQALRGTLRYVARLRAYAPQAVEDQLAAPRPDTKLAIPPTESFALVIAEPGNLQGLRLQPVARHAPGPGEVEIAVHASGINFKDLMGALGLLPIGSQLTSGEYAGVIVRVGPGVEGLRAGDEVIALSRSSFSSFVVAPANNVVPKPVCLSFEEAVTIPVAFLTAYYALHHVARLGKGERILIHSAAGGLGLAAVQIAQSVGAEIFATTGSPEKRAFLESLGIAHVMNSRSTAFADEVLRLTGGEGVDVILNSLSGEAITKGLAILRPFGRFVDVTKLDIYQNSPVGLYPFYKGLSYSTIDLGWIVRDRPDLAHALFKAILEQIEAGLLRPLPLQVYPIQDAVDAFLCMAQRKNIGKLVLAMHPGAAAPAGAPALTFHPDATYLITGGLGGLGLRVARWMVQQGAVNLVLVGRRGATGAAQAAVRDLEAAGTRVVVARADVADRRQMAGLLAQIARDLPPLRGVVHAAGVLDDGALLQLNAERFAKVMAPKVAGAWNLHQLTADLPLEFFVLFSSSASVFGSPGQGNYVAANAFLDALAQLRRQQGRPALSVNWGAWADVGMAADTFKDNKLLAGQQVPMIQPEQGVQLIGQLLQLDLAQIAVLPAPAQQLLAMYPRATDMPMFSEVIGEGAAAGTRAHTSLRARPDLAVPYVAPRSEIEQATAEIWQTVLGIERVGIHDNFFELGGHSLLASQLIRLLCQAFGVDLPLRSLYKAPTIGELAPLIEDLLIQEIDELAEEEAQRSLQELA